MMPGAEETRRPSDDAWTGLLAEAAEQSAADWTDALGAKLARRARLQMWAELAIVAIGAVLIVLGGRG